MTEINRQELTRSFLRLLAQHRQEVDENEADTSNVSSLPPSKQPDQEESVTSLLHLRSPSETTDLSILEYARTHQPQPSALFSLRARCAKWWKELGTYSPLRPYLTMAILFLLVGGLSLVRWTTLLLQSQPPTEQVSSKRPPTKALEKHTTRAQPENVLTVPTIKENYAKEPPKAEMRIGDRKQKRKQNSIVPKKRRLQRRKNIIPLPKTRKPRKTRGKGFFRRRRNAKTQALPKGRPPRSPALQLAPPPPSRRLTPSPPPSFRRLAPSYAHPPRAAKSALSRAMPVEQNPPQTKTDADKPHNLPRKRKASSASPLERATPLATMMAGDRAFRNHRFARAKQLYLRALQHPIHPLVKSRLHRHLGVIYAREAKQTHARKHFINAVFFAPKGAKATAYKQCLAEFRRLPQTIRVYLSRSMPPLSAFNWRERPNKK